MTIDSAVLGWLSLLLTVAAYLPYIVSTARGNTRPHVFSWAIWALLMIIAAAGQYAGNAGPGSWATGLSGLFCVLIAIMAMQQKGDKSISRHDVLILMGAIAAMPLWYITKNPLSAVVTVTLIDAVGYIPTLRKSWRQPRQEMPLHYIISNVKHLVAIGAMQAFTFTTLLYPLSLFVLNTVLIGLIYYRRGKTAAAVVKAPLP